MTSSGHAGYSRKAQLKIQQMAFVLLAIMVFFSLVAFVYLSIWTSNLKEKAEEIKEDEAIRIVRTITGTPELSFTSSSDCSSCIDLDKVFALKKLSSNTDYEALWNLDYLVIEKIYPLSESRECSTANYPNCTKITITSKENFGLPESSFVTLARFTPEEGGYYRYELGKVYVSGLNND